MALGCRRAVIDARKFALPHSISPLTPALIVPMSQVNTTLLTSGSVGSETDVSHEISPYAESQRESTVYNCSIFSGFRMTR